MFDIGRVMIHLIFDVRRFDVVGRDFNSRRQELLSQFRASVEMRGDVDARIELAGEEKSASAVSAVILDPSETFLSFSRAQPRRNSAFDLIWEYVGSSTRVSNTSQQYNSHSVKFSSLYMTRAIFR